MASASSACLTSWVKSSFFPHPSMERCNFHEWYSVPIFEMECLYDILWLCLPWHVRSFRELGEAHGSTWKHMEAREASETEKRMSSVITFPDQTSALIACSISSVSLVTSFFDTIWFGRGRVLSGVLSDLLCPHHVLIFQQHQHWIRRICRPNINDVSSYEEWRRCIFNRVHRAAQIHRLQQLCDREFWTLLYEIPTFHIPIIPMQHPILSWSCASL